MQYFTLLICCLSILSSFLNAEERFPITGSYHEDSSGMDLMIDDTRHLSISNVYWSYPNPLMSSGATSYKTTGYYPKGGCNVPVRTVIDYDEGTKNLYVEFHQPTAIINGFLGCSFPGDSAEFHQLHPSSNTTLNWQRYMEGQGCGEWNAKASLEKQINKYTAECTTQGGKSSTKLNTMPLCTQPDPNDMLCPSGQCSWGGQFYCTFVQK